LTSAGAACPPRPDQAQHGRLVDINSGCGMIAGS
jgi:hypothetical protein